MSGTFPWTCPYCNRDTTITGSNFAVKQELFDNNNIDGVLRFTTTMIACPNHKCRQYTLHASLHKGAIIQGTGRFLPDPKPLMEWALKPNSNAKPVPDYVPLAIRNDYNEACLIRVLSPKASATLSRRSLQGMIRDFHGISKGTLNQEILALKDKIDATTWAGIDAVRSIGNIGAHMEKDINVIIDVEPEEAQLLIGLIEMLIKEWYITRHDREVRIKELVALAQVKKAPPSDDLTNS
jgi:hypothetical protein